MAVAHATLQIYDAKGLERVMSVYNLFKKAVDPQNKFNFFSPEHKQQFDKMIKYVKRGLLSDPPGIDMYIELPRHRQPKHGKFTLYRCLRTSSAVEGYHQHLSRAIHVCAKIAGSLWLSLLRKMWHARLRQAA